MLHWGGGFLSTKQTCVFSFSAKERPVDSSPLTPRLYTDILVDVSSMICSCCMHTWQPPCVSWDSPAFYPSLPLSPHLNTFPLISFMVLSAKVILFVKYHTSFLHFCFYIHSTFEMLFHIWIYMPFSVFIIIIQGCSEYFTFNQVSDSDHLIAAA